MPPIIQDTNTQTQSDLAISTPGRMYTHMYVWIVGFSVLALISAITLTAYIFYASKSVAPLVEDVVPWTAEDKKDALEQLHEEAMKQGVQELTAEQKRQILKNGSIGI